ncbi:MAG: GH3 auxin-responsive promoter family protein, partial [Chloroflexi bacterium]|nr:GH3 auxin-responsive promoter family protein [Chloroflexota bacterium]
PESEWVRSKEDGRYQPATRLINELEEGNIYELVITNFYGMPFIRYRLGDLVKVTSMGESQTGIRLPQFSFYSRADGLIDLYSIVRLDERTVWQALTDTGIGYEDWSARKEYERGWPVLRLYVEPKQEAAIPAWEQSLHERLQAMEPFYAEAVAEVKTNPVRITLLPKGSFQRYYEEQRRTGADLAHLKPPHMNATDAAIRQLLQQGTK